VSRKKISDKETKLLCLQSKGICAFPNCGKSLIQDGTNLDEPVVTGEIAHIVAYEPGGPRGDSSFPEEERNKHTNLILLCGDHHKLIDSQVNTYSIPVLREMKRAHETRSRSLSQADRPDILEPFVIESLHSSLLAVSHLPAVVFSAPTDYNDRQEHQVKEQMQYPSDEWELAPFLLKEGRLYTFHDLREADNPFHTVTSNLDIQMIPAQMLWDSAEGKRRYQTLLNRALYKFTSRLNIRYDPDHRRYFFPANDDKKERVVIYRPLNQKQSKRKVAWPQQRKATGETKNFWIHLASSLKFYEMAPLQWCLSIRPERHFTSDGSLPLPPKQIGRRATRLKAKMYNDLYLSEVHFWRDYLSQRKPQIVLNFGNQSAIIDTSQLLNFDIEWLGIANDTKQFKNQVCTHDLFSLNEYLQALEGEGTDYEEQDDELDDDE
jgi:hypothetical protein